MVENQVGNRELVITDTSPRQTVYIYNCTGCTIQVGAGGAGFRSCCCCCCRRLLLLRLLLRLVRLRLLLLRLLAC